MPLHEASAAGREAAGALVAVKERRLRDDDQRVGQCLGGFRGLERRIAHLLRRRHHPLAPGDRLARRVEGPP